MCLVSSFFLFLFPSLHRDNNQNPDFLAPQLIQEQPFTMSDSEEDAFVLSQDDSDDYEPEEAPKKVRVSPPTRS